LTRKPNRRAKEDEVIGTKVRASFIGSARTYGARRVWRDVLSEGLSCGLHKIERLLADNGVICSMSRSGNVWDNAAMESFFSSLKTERQRAKHIGQEIRPGPTCSITSSASTTRFESTRRWDISARLSLRQRLG
jgi:transposase InsO family protein